MITNLYKPAQAAQVLGVSKSLIYRMIGEGDLIAVRFGRSCRIKPEDLEKFIEIHTNNKPGVNAGYQ